MPLGCLSAKNHSNESVTRAEPGRLAPIMPGHVPQSRQKKVVLYGETATAVASRINVSHKTTLLQFIIYSAMWGKQYVPLYDSV